MTRARLAPGVPGVFVLSWRENYNAHGFEALSIYVDNTERRGQDKERLFLTASGGVDCDLHDFRFVRLPDGDVELITADRAFGGSFADSQQVTFTYFVLAHNSSGQIGRPPYYFRLENVQKSRVNEAFRTELGLAGYRVRKFGSE